MISGGFEGHLLYCELKCRGCNPDTFTADGKADRNLRGLYSFGKGVVNSAFFRIRGCISKKTRKYGICKGVEV